MFVVEGENEEVEILEQLCKLFNINGNYVVVPNKGTIHNLIKRIKKNSIDYNDHETLSLLYELELIDQKMIDAKFTDIFFYFDSDFQDKNYNKNDFKIFVSNYSNSTEEGMIIINYPMVESISHNCLEHSSNKIFYKIKSKEFKKMKKFDISELQTKNDVYNIMRININRLIKMFDLSSITYEKFISITQSMILDKQLELVQKCDEVLILNQIIFMPILYYGVTIFNDLMEVL